MPKLRNDRRYRSYINLQIQRYQGDNEESRRDLGTSPQGHTYKTTTGGNNDIDTGLP